jgi:hypothetical protein
MKKMFVILAFLAFAIPVPGVMAVDRNPSALQQQWNAVVAQAQKDNAAMTTSVQQLQSVKIDTNKRSK